MRGVVMQEGEGVGRAGVGLWGAWRWGGVRAAEAGDGACWKREARRWRRRRGRGFKLTLLTLEEKASGEAVTEGGSGPAFMLVPEGWDSLCA